MSARAELRALTGARGLAAWLVVGFHLRQSIAGLPTPALAVLDKGYLAVDFFFLLSGFVIWLTYAERLRAEGVRGIAPFLWRRVARIWPLHLAMLGAAIALMTLLALTGRTDPIRFPVADLPANILLVQNWGITGRLSWNDPAWSISAELAAYLAFPWAVFMIDWRRAPAWLLVGAIVVLVALLHLIFTAAGATTLGHDIPHLGVPRCLCEFGAGTAVAALWQRLRSQPGSAVIAAVAAAAAFAGWALGVPETIAVPPGFAALLLLLALTAGRAGNPLEGRTVHYLGEISYATYLVHFLLFYAFKLALVRDAAAVPPALVGLYLLLVLAASIILYHGVERPAQRQLLTISRQKRHSVTTLTLP